MDLQQNTSTEARASSSQMFVFPKSYDVIVIGAGHAGIESVLAAARMGCNCLLLTTNPDTIGQMSCNPAIGGLGKGHLAREIDALGGEMGKCTDLTGIHFRMLNTRKGPAVQAPRAQCDKRAYQARMKYVCEKQQNLDIRLGSAIALVVKDGTCLGVDTDLGVRYLSKTTILTTGTFLRGLMHVGQNQRPGGRSGESPSFGLTESLKSIGISTARLKTGTPPRIHRRTIDFSKTEIQHSDESIPWFSYWQSELFHVEHESSKSLNQPKLQSQALIKANGPAHCYITRTTEQTETAIRANLHKSPMYSGAIEGTGPRYCPSIEDKIVRFPEKSSHQIFLEPEGVNTEEIYINGFSTCLPFEVQCELVRTIIGCEHAEIIRPAYAVEYDFVEPTQLNPYLETKVCKNLFLAGQINGTSGYEEAGAQGIIAGANAALSALGKPSVSIRRNQGYIGVLIDDLITKGTSEPYRMFTSRAEHRLLLRQDNADIRLAELGYSIGILGKSCFDSVMLKRTMIENEINRLASTRYEGQSLAQLLRRPELNYKNLPLANISLPADVAQQVEIEIKYQGYIERQSREAGRQAKEEGKLIPKGTDFQAVIGLRAEAKQKLTAIRPQSIGQASRISGITPSDISVLLVWLSKASTCAGSD